MSDSATGGPPPTADPQDPLPDPNWFYRRSFVFATTAFICWQLHRYGDRFADIAVLRPDLGIPALRELVLWLIWVVILQSMIYLIAPSAEQFGKWLATVSAWKGGISTTSTARSTSADGSTAEATRSAGPAAQPSRQPEADGGELPESERIA